MSKPVQELERQILHREKYGRVAEDDDIDLEELLDGEDEFLAHYREKRVQELSHHFKTVEKNVTQEGYGSLQNIDDESSLIQTAANTARTVVHFGLSTFQKCKYMDQKLELLAESHLTTKFVRIDVENCPFLVSKLNIKVLPFVVAYKQGKEALRIVGFSTLGNDPDGFAIESLESVLSQAGIIERRNFGNRDNDDNHGDLDL